MYKIASSAKIVLLHQLWELRSQRINPNGALERTQKAAQQDCVQEKKHCEEICWGINGFVWYSQMLALTKQLAHSFFYYLWHVSVICVPATHRAHLCVCPTAAPFSSWQRHWAIAEEKSRKTKVHLISGEIDFKTKQSNVSLYIELSHQEITRWITASSSVIIRGELVLMSCVYCSAKKA